MDQWQEEKSEVMEEEWGWLSNKKEEEMGRECIENEKI